MSAREEGFERLLAEIGAIDLRASPTGARRRASQGEQTSCNSRIATTGRFLPVNRRVV
jgi:hypothetical protein